MEKTMIYDSPIGKLTLSGDGTGITGLWIEGQKYFGRTLEAGSREENSCHEAPDKDFCEVFGRACKWLDAYFKGEKEEISFPLAPKGSAFQRSVWDILREIPYGETTTYGEIAKILSDRQKRPSMSAQAVGGAVARNPISILIPCHRVVGTNGSLTGYAGGMERKIKLLTLEGVDTKRFFIPDVKKRANKVVQKN